MALKLCLLLNRSDTRRPSQQRAGWFGGSDTRDRPTYYVGVLVSGDSYIREPDGAFDAGTGSISITSCFGFRPYVMFHSWERSVSVCTDKYPVILWYIVKISIELYGPEIEVKRYY